MAYHGVLSERESVGVRPVEIVTPSIIGVVGTAPNADPNGAFAVGGNIQYNVPFYLTGRQDADTENLGAGGSLATDLNGIYASGRPAVQMVIVEEPTGASAIASVDLAVHKYNAAATKAAVDGLTGNDVEWAFYREEGKNYLAFKANLTEADKAVLRGLKPSRTITIHPNTAATLLDTFTIAASYDERNNRIEVVEATIEGVTDGADFDLKTNAVSVEEVTKFETISNLLGSEADGTGIYALLAADPKPKILVCGHPLAIDNANIAASPIHAGLIAAARKAMGIAVIDGPNTTMQDAVAYAENFGQPEAFMVDPGIITADGEVSASPTVAGLISYNDLRRGYYTSPSNQVLNGVIGTQRAVPTGFVGSQADVLNTAQVATIVKDGGFRLWGNETLAKPDPSYRFLPILRTANVIEESLRESIQWAVDRNITVRFFENVTQSVNSFLAGLEAEGAITGGECYADSERNTPASIKQGSVYFRIEWSGSYPAQTLNLTISLTDRFLEALLAEIG